MAYFIKVYIVVFLIIPTITAQNGNNGADSNQKLNLKEILKVLPAILKKSHDDVTDNVATNILRNTSYISNVLQEVIGKRLSADSIQRLTKILNETDAESFANLLNGNFNFLPIIPTFLTLPKLSLSCSMDLYNLAKPFIKNGTIVIDPVALLTSPLGSMIDAWGKPGSGILDGNIQWLGALKECEAKEFHYCQTKFTFFERFFGRYGTCVPKSCNTDDVGQILTIIQKVKYLKGTTIKFLPKTTQCVEEVKYTTGAKITIALLLFLCLLCLLGTITDTLQDVFTPSDEFVPNFAEQINYNRLNDEHNGELEDNKEVSLRSSPKVKITRGNMLTNILISFSCIKNIKTLISTNEVKGAIGSINGMRFISMTWVILGHYFFIAQTLQNSDNSISALNELRTFSFMPINNAYVAVDTFFILSGLLVAYLTLRRIDKNGGMSIPQYLLYLFHRYLRLTPSLGIVILFVTNIFPMILSGPLSLEVQQSSGYQQNCRDYWWTDLLYINNFYPKEFGKQCVGWVWYLANDWQFYVISPGIILLMVFTERKLERTRFRHVGAFIIIGLLCFISLMITMVILLVYKYPTLITAFYLQGNPRVSLAGGSTNILYEKPYTRISPYLVGLLLGYIFSRKLLFRPRHSRIANLIGWSSAITVALAIIYGPWHVFRIQNQSFMTDTENIFFGTFHRFAWSIAVAWVIYACHNKMGGFINRFLSWKAFLPLSRLTYGAYLMHIPVLEYYYLVHETPNHIQANLVAFPFISTVVLAYSCSFILSILVELPIANLEKLLLPS